MDPQSIMTIILAVVTHLVIIAGIFSLIFFVYYLIRNNTRTVESVLRTMSAMTGFLIYLGAKAVGLSIPDMIMNSLSMTQPFTFGFINIIIPAASGFLVSWYCIYHINSNENISIRIVILIVSFIITIFSDVYASSYGYSESGSANIEALLPNLTFTIGLSLYVIFNYEHSDLDLR